MTTNFKTDVRARMLATGEKYTEARRALLAQREAADGPSGGVERIFIHTTNNGFPLADANCEATTNAGNQCGNSIIYGQCWAGGHPEQILPDGPETRKLAQRRCHVHVHHELHAEVVLIMDDVDPTPLSGIRSSPAWQDPRSLDLIRRATSGRARTEALALYGTLTSPDSPDAVAEVGARCGLSEQEAESAMSVLVDLGLVRDGALVA